MKLKKTSIFKLSKKDVFTIIVSVVILSVLFLANSVNKEASKIILNYGEIEAKKLGSIIMTKSVDHEFTKNIEVNNLFKIHRSESGNIDLIEMDNIIANQILFKVSSIVQKNLLLFEQGNLDKLEIAEDVLGTYNIDKIKKGVFMECLLFQSSSERSVATIDLSLLPF